MSDLQADVVVIGAGPGGYSAAFRAADLGKKVILIDRSATLGGVCLNVGCIPSKALLHVAKVISEAAETPGVRFGTPELDLPALRDWKNSVVAKLTKGLTTLAKQRKVTVLNGQAQFASPNSVRVEMADGTTTVSFEHGIIAAGSSVTRIPGFPYDDPRLMDSTGALALDDVPCKLLVIGGGIIGLEMATVYQAFGSQVTVVEWMDQLIPGADADLVKPLATRLAKQKVRVLLKTKVTRLESLSNGLRATFEGPEAPEAAAYDRVLVAVGRRPNGLAINAEAAGVKVDDRGFIPVDGQMRTNVPHIFAIGDISGEPMLAHKASHEGKLAAEVVAGHKVSFQARTIPSVAYTDPEISWAGVTENAAKKQGLDIEKAIFPWAACGRAITIGRDEGLTKLIIDKKTRRIIGAGIVGAGAGELIAEVVVAMELDAEVGDLALAIHPHPTLSETIALAAEIAEGSITDIYLPKK
ncbi:MAG: dihydrolipoyl dehydrogenase [Glaciimonas sp.]|nr:dihydrolipoyl dehydrogenase [Glaciimonas sp.]